MALAVDSTLVSVIILVISTFKGMFNNDKHITNGLGIMMTILKGMFNDDHTILAYHAWPLLVYQSL